MPGVAERVFGVHMKNHHVIPGLPLRCMVNAWPDRAMQFTDLNRGDLDLVRYTEVMLRIGYARRYCQIMGTKTAPLVVEAEAAYECLDDVAARGIGFVANDCCFDAAEGSFEDGMGAK